MSKHKFSDEEFKKMKEQAEFRGFQMGVRAAEVDGESDEMIVEGYAATFDRETVLFEYDGVEYKEVIDRQAFASADMSDVIFNYNHGGYVSARTRNSTLELAIDNIGLHVRADLSGTTEGRQLYEMIQGGFIDRMSFRFKVSEDSYNRETHTRRIIGISKVWDVSAVDIPAYESTSISARSFFKMEIEKEALEKVEIEQRKKKLELKLKLSGGI